MHDRGHPPHRRSADLSPGARAAVGYLTALLTARSNAAARLAVLAAAPGAAPAAVWGAGGDWRAMREEAPELAELLRAGRLTLFDEERQGQTEEGRVIAAPAALGAHPGLICPTPSSPTVRDEMRSLCAAWTEGDRRFVDPYDDPPARGPATRDPPARDPPARDDPGAAAPPEAT